MPITKKDIKRKIEWRDNTREWTENRKKLNIYEKLHLAASLYYRDLADGWMYKTRARWRLEHIKAKEMYLELMDCL